MGRQLSKRGGVRFLSKAHRPGCQNTHGPLENCDCPWRARYRKRRGARQQVMLAKWANPAIEPRVDPRSKRSAVLALDRLKVAIDGGFYDPAGERAPLGTDQSVAAFITEWKSRYVEKRKLSGNSLSACLGVIARGPIGKLSLEAMAEASDAIERWLDDEGAARQWTAKTWNSYHQILHRLCYHAMVWKVDGKPRLAINPMATIERRRGSKGSPNRFQDVRLDADLETKLLAACDLLNRVQHKPNRTQLTMEKADAIRALVAAGETQVAVAKAFKIKPPTVNGIVKGETWNPAKYRVSTRGTEMRRRLIAALDTGLRAGELLQVQVKHVLWSRPQTFEEKDGTPFKGYKIVLPAELTKGGKTTGEDETVYVATARLARELEARRFALKNEPNAFLFGTEEGWRVLGLKRVWRELFTLAGLDWGRDEGMVWHTLRHEYISRLADLTKDPVLTQHMARHRDLKTTQLYFRTGQDKKWGAAAGLNR